MWPLSFHLIKWTVRHLWWCRYVLNIDFNSPDAGWRSWRISGVHDPLWWHFYCCWAAHVAAARNQQAKAPGDDGGRRKFQMNPDSFFISIFRRWVNLRPRWKNRDAIFFYVYSHVSICITIARCSYFIGWLWCNSRHICIYDVHMQVHLRHRTNGN